MNTPRPPSNPPSHGSPDRSGGRHLATIGHEGRFWDVYLRFEDDPRRPDSHRAHLAFSPADGEEGEEEVRTTTIIIEPSLEEAVHKARSLDDHQLQSLLRSALD